jgi:hypothetical protein
MGRGNPGEAMEPHSIVVISLQNPKEKLWGELLDVTNAGVTVRGIDLSSFDDFVSQVLHPDGDRMGLPTLFFPMLRIERIALDEPRGSFACGNVSKKNGPLAGELLGAIRLNASIFFP